MNKESIKNYLIISFVVIEILSMIFNFYLVKINLGNFEFNFNFSVVFFCLAFFIVDIVADNFSPADANKFIYYKLYSQTLFLVLGHFAISIYSLQDSEIANMLAKSPWIMVSGIISTYIGFYVMNTIMSHMKIRTYQGGSVFKRYLYSTIPGELLFSFTFTIFCFYKFKSANELLNIFIASSLAKIILSIFFASIISLIIKIKNINNKATQPVDIRSN